MVQEYLGRKESRRTMRLPPSLELLRHRAAKAFGMEDVDSVELWLDAGAQGRRGRGTMHVTTEEQYKKIKEDDVVVVKIDGRQIDPTDLTEVYLSTTQQSFVPQTPQPGATRHITGATSELVVMKNEKFKAKTSYRDEYPPIHMRARPASVCSTARPASVCSARPAAACSSRQVSQLASQPASDNMKSDRPTGISIMQESYKTPTDLRYKSISEIERSLRAPTPQPRNATRNTKIRHPLSWCPGPSEYSAAFLSHPANQPARRGMGKTETRSPTNEGMPGLPRTAFRPPTPPQRALAPPPNTEPPIVGDRQTGRSHYQDTFVSHSQSLADPLEIPTPQEAWGPPKGHHVPFIHMEPYVGTEVIG